MKRVHTYDDAVVVDISQHNTYEDWVTVKQDGSIVYHHELDGWAAKNGLNESDTPLTLAEARNHTAVRNVIADVEAALRHFGHAV